MAAVAPTPVEPARQASGRPGKLRLGDVLVQQRLISQEQLQQTLELQRQTGKKTWRLLVETGVITEELLANGPCMRIQTQRYRNRLARLRTHAIVANPRYSYGYASALHLGPSAIHHFYFVPAPRCPH